MSTYTETTYTDDNFLTFHKPSIMNVYGKEIGRMHIISYNDENNVNIQDGIEKIIYTGLSFRDLSESLRIDDGLKDYIKNLIHERTFSEEIEYVISFDLKNHSYPCFFNISIEKDVSIKEKRFFSYSEIKIIDEIIEKTIKYFNLVDLFDNKNSLSKEIEENISNDEDPVLKNILLQTFFKSICEKHSTEIDSNGNVTSYDYICVPPSIDNYNDYKTEDNNSGDTYTVPSYVADKAIRLAFEAGLNNR